MNTSTQQALAWLPVLRDHEVQWLGEPLSVKDEPYIKEVHARGEVPIAGGENVLMPPGADAERLAELDINRNPLRTDIFEEPFDVVDDCIRIPEAPGLGWRLKRKA